MKTTHLPHLLGAPPGPARQLAGRLGAIVEAATAVALEQFVDDAAVCPEHPRRCGRAVMAARVEGAVWWACGACLATGRVTGWEGTAVDRRQGLDGGTPVAASALAGPPWPSASGTFTTFAKFLI